MPPCRARPWLRTPRSFCPPGAPATYPGSLGGTDGGLPKPRRMIFSTQNSTGETALVMSRPFLKSRGTPISFHFQHEPLTLKTKALFLSHSSSLYLMSDLHPFINFLTDRTSLSADPTADGGLRMLVCLHILHWLIACPICFTLSFIARIKGGLFNLTHPHPLPPNWSVNLLGWMVHG